MTLTGNRLTVLGKREAETQEQTDTYYAYECSYDDFTRSFTLLEGADANGINADLKDSVLTPFWHGGRRFGSLRTNESISRS